MEERQFEAICIRTLNAKTHFLNFKTSLAKLKAEKPKAVRLKIITRCVDIYFIYLFGF